MATQLPVRGLARRVPTIRRPTANGRTTVLLGVAGLVLLGLASCTTLHRPQHRSQDPPKRDVTNRTGPSLHQSQPSKTPTEKVREPEAQSQTRTRTESLREVGDDERIIFAVGNKRLDITLHDAAEKGNIGKIRRLLDAGDQVDGKDVFGRTPLFYAIVKGRAEVCRLLLYVGAHVETVVGGQPLLHYAVRIIGKDEALTELLLANDADPNSLGDDGRTAMSRAAELGHFGSVRLLLGKGADPELKDKTGRTASDYVGEANKAEFEALLRQPR